MTEADTDNVGHIRVDEFRRLHKNLIDFNPELFVPINVTFVNAHLNLASGI